METENPGVTDNLHSTMLLLYRAHLLHQGSPMSIYIPLCFYFIIGRILSHVFGIKIYIPLCFYFIKCRLSSMVMQGIIYIPLCFYFIHQRQMCRVATCVHLHSTMLLLYRSRRQNRPRMISRFTFHYASTLSGSVIDFATAFVQFTFHYASTLSEFLIKDYAINELFTFHYASTLSLFPLKRPTFPGVFTFHYASTLSNMPD